MAEKLGLEAAFMQAYSQRVRELPGHGRFRTGISLRAPFKRLSESSGDSSSEDRFILFLSFPYFGRYNKGVGPSLESESVTLLNFKRLKVHASDRSEGDGGDIRKRSTKGGDDKGKTPAEEERGDRGKRPAEEEEEEEEERDMGKAPAEEERDDMGKTSEEEERDDKRKAPAEERADIREILVHQARYMIFDNRKLYFLACC